MSTPPLAGPGLPSGPFSGPQGQAAREVNTASLCRIGQETVQDIVFRTMEIFQLLRNMQLPNGVTYHTGTYQDRLGKLQEHLRQLSILFRKLRLVYDKCNENCAGLEPIPIEQLIPYVEEDGFKHDDRGATNQLLFASEERREIMEVIKNQGQVVEVIFHSVKTDSTQYDLVSGLVFAFGSGVFKLGPFMTCGFQLPEFLSQRALDSQLMTE